MEIGLGGLENSGFQRGAVEMKEARWRALTFSDSWMELDKEETETMRNAVQIVQ